MEIGFKLDLGIAESASRGGRIRTGIHKVEIIHAWVGKTENGNNIVDFEIRSENDEVGFINRVCIDEKWASGTENLDYKRWQEFAACAGMKSLTLVSGNRNTANGEVSTKEISELKGKHVTVAVYEEFDVYNNKEKVSLKLQNTFGKTGQTIAEAIAKKPAERIEKLRERLVKSETKEYKAWKLGGGDAAIDNVSLSNIGTPQVVAVAEEDEDELFG